MRIKNRLKKIKTEEAGRVLKAQAKAYKKVNNKSRKSFRKKFHKTIRNMKSNNVKDYWDLLKNADKSEQICKITLKTFRDYFAKLSQSPEISDKQQDERIDPRIPINPVNGELNTLQLRQKE